MSSNCSLSGNPPYDCSGCDLTGVNLAGKDLTKANFQHAILTGTVFKGALSLAGADFTSAVMYGTDFSGCDLSTAIFGPSPRFSLDPTKPTKFIGATIPFASLGKVWNNLDLTNANITGLPSDLSQLQASGAVLPGFSFAGKILNNAHFIGSKLAGADFTGAQLNNAVFTSLTDLTGAKFPGCPMSFAVFDTATLTRANFAGASMNGVSLLQTRMDGTVFDGVDVTVCSFSQPPRFSSAPTNLTSFRNATIDYSTLLKVWTCLDLTGAIIVGLTSAVDLSYLQAQYTVLGALDLSGYTLTQSDFTGATLNATKFIGPSTKLGYACFNGATGPAVRFDGAFLQNVTFEANPANSVNAVFQNAVYSNADLTNAGFRGADLTGAHLVQALLHGATLTNMTLAGADLTGAQMGTQSLLFSVTNPTQYQQLLAELTKFDVPDVLQVLQANGVNVTHISIGQPYQAQGGNVWVITDTDTQATYTARQLSINGQNAISVYADNAQHANLGGSYMPQAILTQANMAGMTASGIHLYGGAKLDSAILEGVDFTASNLGDANLKEATLNDAIFDDCVLTNAHFDGAPLLPGQEGRGVSMQRANLQGASFNNAKLFGANLQNAAICLPSSAPQGTYGVWLTEILPTDSAYQATLAELENAQTLTTLDPSYESDLAPGIISSTVMTALNQAGIMVSPNATVTIVESDQTFLVVDGGANYLIIPGIDNNALASYQVIPSNSTSPFYIPLADGALFRTGSVSAQVRSDFQSSGGVTLSSNAAMTTTQRAVIWQIIDTTVYDLWDGFDSNDQRQLFVRTSIPSLTSLLAAAGVTLKRTVVSAVSVGFWSLDNDSENPFNTALGYVVMNVALAKAGSPIEIYGASLRIEQLVSEDALGYFTIPCAPTLIVAGNFDQNTYFPNGNKEPGVLSGTLDPTWMRAKQPPRPPTCVPNGNSYCPMTNAGAVMTQAVSARAG